MAQGLSIKINVPACSGCRWCEMACSLYHEGVVNLEKARIRVSDNYARSLFEPHICQLCDSPPCVDACPTAALSQDTETGIIIVNSSLCNGCAACVSACPHDAIRWSDEMERLFICDLCDGRPVCVDFCTSGALRKDKRE